MKGLRVFTRGAVGCLGLALVIALALFLARALWLPRIGGFLIAPDPLRPADAVVALGGGHRNRVQEAARLVREGVAPWLVVTDSPLDMPGIRASYADLMRQEAIWQGAPADRILQPPEQVRTTDDEARAARRLADHEGWDALIVVSDPYHTRRAGLIFRRAFADSGVEIIVWPAPDSWYDPARWWQTTDGLRETWIEWTKLLLHFAGYE